MEQDEPFVRYEDEESESHVFDEEQRAEEDRRQLALL